MIITAAAGNGSIQKEMIARLTQKHDTYKYMDNNIIGMGGRTMTFPSKLSNSVILKYCF